MAPPGSVPAAVSRYRVASRYVLAVAASAAALVLTWLLPDALQRPFFLFFIAAAGVSAWYGGWRPGLVSVALSSLASAYFFLPPHGSLRLLAPLDQARLGLFALSAVFIVWLFSRLRSTQIALERSRDQFRRAQRSANIAAFDWELASGRLWWSEELPALRGLNPGGDAQHWLELIHPDDRKRLQRAIDEAIVSGAELNADARLGLPDGSNPWISVRGQVFFEEDGNPVRMLGVAVDITRRKAAESRLEAQHAVTQALVESSDPAAAIPNVLRIICSALGWVLGQYWLVDEAAHVLRPFVTWRDGPQLECFERDLQAVTFDPGAGLPGRVWQAAQPAWVQDLTQEPDTARRDAFARAGLCSAFAFPIRLDSRVLGVLEFFCVQPRPADHDLLQTAADMGAQIGQFSERCRAAAALRDSEERYRTTLGSIADAVIATDAQGRVQFINAIAQELTGWSQPEAAARPLAEIFRVVREVSREPVEDPVRQVLQSGGPAPLVQGAALLARDGKTIPIDDSAAPIRNDAGALIGVVLVFRDISGRRRAEDALRASERLAATGRLAATIAHEINNPMEAVANLLYLLEHHPGLDHTAGEYARMAEQELERMDKIVKQTLGFYRESAKPVLVRIPTLLDNVLELYARKLQKGRVHLGKRYRYDGEVRAFPGEMRQVFSNLIANALEATGEGGTIILHVRRSCDWSGQRRPGVRVTVADDGAGIARENLHRIFEPFFTTKGVNGTGLGLWITYGIVRKHGGRIHVRSNQRGSRPGTCFSVFLPDSAASPDSTGVSSTEAVEPSSQAA